VPHTRASRLNPASEDLREMPICANCELEVPWTPVQRGGNTFCCAGCALGGPCSCSYDNFDYSDASSNRLSTREYRHAPYL
jgi:hypothetical protein